MQNIIHIINIFHKIPMQKYQITYILWGNIKKCPSIQGNSNKELKGQTGGGLFTLQLLPV